MDRIVFLLPNFSAMKPTGMEEHNAPIVNKEPTNPPSLSVNWNGTNTFVPFCDINCGNTGEVHASTDPAHTTPRETESKTKEN